MLHLNPATQQSAYLYLSVKNQTAVSDVTCVKKVKFALEEAMKAQRGSRGIALLFL